MVDVGQRTESKSLAPWHREDTSSKPLASRGPFNCPWAATVDGTLGALLSELGSF